MAEIEEPSRVCPRCAAISQTGGPYCPHCGEPFAGRSGIPKRTKLVVASLVMLLLLAGAGAAVAIKLHHDGQVAARHRAEAAARLHAAAARRVAEQQAQATREAEVHERETMEQSLETAITKDAQHDVEQEILTGPIERTECTPISGGSSQDLSHSTGTYSCLAINKMNADGTDSGYHFSGTINFKTGTSTWRLGGGE